MHTQSLLMNSFEAICAAFHGSPWRRERTFVRAWFDDSVAPRTDRGVTVR